MTITKSFGIFVVVRLTGYNIIKYGKTQGICLMIQHKRVSLQRSNKISTYADDFR